MAIIVLPRRILWGEDVASALSSLIDELDARSIVIVTDKILRKQSWFDPIIDSIRKPGVTVYIYDNVGPEPSLTIADEVAAVLNENKPDLLVAVGGGSVIDAAKAGKVKFLLPSISVEEIAPFSPLHIEFKKPVLIAIPTTAGTGSDASYGIVLTKIGERGREKIDVANYDLVPYATILDPKLPSSAPQHLIVGAALDALGHAFEALVANQANPFTDALVEKVIPLIITRLEEALSGSQEAMADIHLAATMAGIAFTNGGLGLIHAIAHPVGAKLGIHHGTTVGIVIPVVIEYNYQDPSSKERYEKIRLILEHIYGLEHQETLQDHILRFYEKIGFKYRLREYGIDRERFEEVKPLIIEEAFHDPSIAFAPLIPSPEELERLVEKLY